MAAKATDAAANRPTYADTHFEFVTRTRLMTSSQTRGPPPFCFLVGCFMAIRHRIMNIAADKSIRFPQFADRKKKRPE
jgi:hypothetical protein